MAEITMVNTANLLTAETAVTRSQSPLRGSLTQFKAVTQGSSAVLVKKKTFIKELEHLNNQTLRCASDVEALMVGSDGQGDAAINMAQLYEVHTTVEVGLGVEDYFIAHNLLCQLNTLKNDLGLLCANMEHIKGGNIELVDIKPTLWVIQEKEEVFIKNVSVLYMQSYTSTYIMLLLLRTFTFTRSISGMTRM
jgi:hypothetical protein